MCYNSKNNRSTSHEGFGALTILLTCLLIGDLQGREVLPLDIYQTLTLMISFGALIVAIMSDKNQKK
ncbi:putative holin-like toxin [Scopulibacillus cellulosilyticus]|uniref:Holin-like toxin n=1 Tax=Scopulibacillus cellulosilyticus TaxID=2665665 RepID=A0ABW2Q0C7_9BACL